MTPTSSAERVAVLRALRRTLVEEGQALVPFLLAAGPLFRPWLDAVMDELCVLEQGNEAEVERRAVQTWAFWRDMEAALPCAGGA